MVNPCDIKTSGKAWNDGVDAFKKAFKQTSGKPGPSLKFAVDEVNRLHPDLNMDPKSFTDPMIAYLKEKGLVSNSYTYSAEKTSNKRSEVDKIVEKMSTLDPSQKKKFARDIFKSISEKGLLSNQEIKNAYADAVGLPAMNDHLEGIIKNTSKALLEDKAVEDEIQAEIKNMQADKESGDGKLTDKQDEEYRKKFEDLGKKRMASKKVVLANTQQFSQQLIEKKFWLHQLTDYMPLNLMNPNSLLKNASGAVADFYTRSLGNSIAPIISKLISLRSGINSNPFGARVKGALNSDIKGRAGAAWSTGSTEFNNELPMANHLKAVDAFRKASEAVGFDKLKKMIGATLKIHPAIIAKGLQVPDAIVFEMTKAGEINRIAEAKGLKGAEKEAFLLDPDDKTREIAINAAKEATFKQDVPAWLTKLSSYDPHERTKALIKEGMSPMSAKMLTSARSIVQKSTFPFIKTPVNIMRTASKILLPEYQLIDNVLKARKETDPIEKQKLYVDGVSRAAAGFFLRGILLEMIYQGMISAGYNDEDKKTKDLVEQKAGGPNRINLSAFFRAISFRGVSERKGDIYGDLSALGATGIAGAIYAHNYNSMGAEEAKDRSEWSKSMTNAVSVPVDLAMSSVATGLDQTFFTGLNQLQSAFRNEHGYERSQTGVNIASNIFTGIAPATYQKVSTQWDPNVKKQFDSDETFSGNLANALGYRFLFQSKDLKDKYYSLAEEEGGGLKKKRNVLFDNILGRVIESEFDFLKITKDKGDGPIERLYDASRSVGKEDRDKIMPNAISDELTVPYKKKGKSRSVKVKLTDEQYDFIKNKASDYRMLASTGFIMSEEFKVMSFDEKAEVLSSLYAQGLKMAKEDLVAKYGNLKDQAVEGTDKAVIKKVKKKYKIKATKQD